MTLRLLTCGLAITAAATLGFVLCRGSVELPIPEALQNPSVSSAHQTPFEETQIQSGPWLLRGALFRPEGPGPFPALVYNHGSEIDPSLEFMGELGAWFQKRGFVVLFPFRRGASGSQGQHWETAVNARPEAERDRAVVEQLDLQSEDVLAAISFLRALPYVDRAFVALAGCSFGGIETVLATERSSEVFAAVNFAGASYSWSSSAPLRDRLISAARNARAPIFFVQASNDFDTTPSIVLSSEMVDAGKPSAVKIFPPHGQTTMEGHAHFCNHGMNDWGPDVLAFLLTAARQRARGTIDGVHHHGQFRP
jgi:carboxymethylenebutenolidase